MKFYFAGGGETHNPLLKQNGVKNRLVSFYRKEMIRLVENERFSFFNLLIDSGGFTAIKKGIEISVIDYARFLNKYEIPIAFNLDVRSVEETLRNQDILERKTKTYIIPVYHVSDWENKQTRGLIKRYVEDYPYIGLGGMVGKSNKIKYAFCNYIFVNFPKIPFHGLGLHGRICENFPFYSVDSTNWLCGEAYNTQAIYKRGRLKGRLRNKKNKKIKSLALAEKHYTHRTQDEINKVLKYEQFITRLWKNRGVEWEELNLERK